MYKRKARSLLLLPSFLVLSLLFVLSACGSTSTGTGSATTTTTASSNQATRTSTTALNNISPTQSSSSSTEASKPQTPLTALRMLDASNGWALNNNSILRTTDGGFHWKDVTPANVQLNQYATGQFMNSQYAWIAIGPANLQEGAGITVLHSTNGGTSWQQSKINDPLVSRADIPHFINAQQGWLEASSTPGAGSALSDIWSSKDGGQTWTRLSSNKSSDGLNLGMVTGISFKDASVGIATGNLGAGGDNSVPSIARSQDGGKTWQTQTLPHLLGGFVNPYNTSQPPVFVGNVVLLPVQVSLQNGTAFVLYRSNDGGRNWVQTSTPSISANNTYVLDTTHAWATDTQSGKLYSTVDGGNNWSPTSNTAYALQALSFTDTQTGWGVSKAQLFHTTDGGKTWQQISYTIQ